MKKRFLAALLAVTMVLSMSMTAFAASSPSSSSSSGHHRSSGGGSASSSSPSSKSSGAASAAAAANAAVMAAYAPAQAVILSDGQAVPAVVTMAAAPAEMAGAWAAVAPAFGGTAVTGTFVYAAAGIDPSQSVTTVLAPGSIPAGSVLLVLDAFGQITVVTPAVAENGMIFVTLPALCQAAVVSLA